jgi:hypothetical protein
MNHKGIAAFLILTFVIFNCKALNIEAYCSDMRNANNFSKEWENRCVATLAVQKKYEKIANDEANQKAVYENARSRSVLLMDIIKIENSLDKTNPDVDKVLAIIFKMKQTCELTESSKKSEEPFCNAESYKPYEKMLQTAKSGK